MSLTSSASAFGVPDTVLPVLSAVVPESEVSDALRSALDARAQEKAAFMAMSDELLHALRPEIERLTAELVRSSLQQAWRMRPQHVDGIVGMDIP